MANWHEIFESVQTLNALEEKKNIIAEIFIYFHLFLPFLL